MGQPSEVKPVQIGTNYSWGEFGSANPYGVNYSPTTTQNIQTTQSGINQYLNELINPSYNNESFRARQDLLDASNQQYARELGAQAIARGARGSATQAILNSLAANRATDMRQAMTQEDARIQNILSALSGIEGNYFNQGNIMANNILSRVQSNQSVENAANATNTANYNAWQNNLLSGIATVAGAIIGGPAGAALAGGATKAALNNKSEG